MKQSSALVRDGAPLYDPLGLESKGVRVDFQIHANAYLYGTRFFTWLAYAYYPRSPGSDRIRKGAASSVHSLATSSACSLIKSRCEILIEQQLHA